MSTDLRYFYVAKRATYAELCVQFLSIIENPNKFNPYKQNKIKKTRL